MFAIIEPSCSWCGHPRVRHRLPRLGASHALYPSSYGPVAGCRRRKPACKRPRGLEGLAILGAPLLICKRFSFISLAMRQDSVVESALLEPIGGTRAHGEGSRWQAPIATLFLGRRPPFLLSLACAHETRDIPRRCRFRASVKLFVPRGGRKALSRKLMVTSTSCTAETATAYIEAVERCSPARRTWGHRRGCDARLLRNRCAHTAGEYLPPVVQMDSGMFCLGQPHPGVA